MLKKKTEPNGNSNLPNWGQLRYIKQFLSRKEKTIIKICLIIIAINLSWLVISFYKNNIQSVPANGGSYTEILVGAPNFINPLYASINNVDGDISSLIYSGLLKRNKDNNLAPDLAEKFEVSENQKEYTFYLKQNIKWHDEKSFSANDVAFTFKAIKNDSYKSPLKASFSGVEVEVIDENSVKFILNEPYSAFLELLTVGILPAEIWQQIPPEAANLADLNLKPVGAGPFKFKSLTKDKSGNIRSYEIEKNKDYYNKPPYLNKMTFKFTPTYSEAVNMLNEKKAEGIDFLAKEYEENITAKNNYNQYFLSQPQFTALFFNNQNLGALSDKRVREALARAIDKTNITDLGGKTQLIEGPVLPMFDEYYNPEITTYPFDMEKSRLLLENAGWELTEVREPEEPEAGEDGENQAEPLIEPGNWLKKSNDFLIVTITTVDQPDTLAAAEKIAAMWEKLNIKVNLDIVPADLIQSEVIKPRSYQILLYGVILGADPDQYPFWHSSQIGPNGLNLANYNNKNVDALLEDGRITNNLEIRQEKYKNFQEIIANELPAIFLFSRKYPYLHSNKIKGFDTEAITIPADRFSNIANWYIDTKKKIVW